MRTLLRLSQSLSHCHFSSALRVEWETRLGEDLATAERYLEPTGELATTFPCPSPGGNGCPRQVHTRPGGYFEAVCGNLPVDCPSLKLRKPDLAVLRLDRDALLRAEATRVAPSLGLRAEPEFALGLLSLGVLERRQGTVVILLATKPDREVASAALHLKNCAQADQVAVVSPQFREVSIGRLGVVQVPMGANGSLELWRVLKLLWPESWAARVQNKGVFEEVQLEFASAPDRHVVRLNGEELHGFRLSDAKFARLLLLAAARAHNHDVEGGGWLAKRYLELDEKENDLRELRDALTGNAPGDCAGLTEEEREGLLQSSKEHPGKLRLPLNPLHVRFDDSLRNLPLLADRATEPKSKRPATKGRAALIKNQAASRARVEQMLERAQAYSALKHLLPAR